MILCAEDFEAALRRIGEERYHHRHSFNRRMHDGQLSREEIQHWVRNRYYYQTRIPIKDGLILAKSDSADFRRKWIERIHDHDGREPGEGGLALWLALAEAVGLERREVESLACVSPGVRRACDAYVDFVERHDLLESVAASLTEMFAGEIMRLRIAAFEKHYPWVDVSGLRYFQSRTTQAPRDAEYGLAYVIKNAQSEQDQRRCLAALERKCEILWALLDAVELGCKRPALVQHALLRTDPKSDKPLVLLPERAIELSSSGSEILSLCDGTRLPEVIVRVLRSRHPDADELEEEVCRFLEEMRDLGVLG